MIRKKILSNCTVTFTTHFSFEYWAWLQTLRTHEKYPLGILFEFCIFKKLMLQLHSSNEKNSHIPYRRLNVIKHFNVLS